jgi:hypothetical protein
VVIYDNCALFHAISLGDPTNLWRYQLVVLMVKLKLFVAVVERKGIDFGLCLLISFGCQIKINVSESSFSLYVVTLKKFRS